MFGKKEEVEKRFETILREPNYGSSSYDDLSTIVIFRDRYTGVHYIHTRDGESGGLTPLLDETGKPIIKK